MKSRAERLDEILNDLIEIAFLAEKPSEYKSALKNTKKELIEFFKECVPGEDLDDDYEPGDYYRSGWNECREETLKNIKEMGK